MKLKILQKSLDVYKRQPLYDAFGLKRVVYNTYQAVSGSGVAGVKDLEEGTCDNYPYPVSYTHLDVYKRQNLHCVFSFIHTIIVLYISQIKLFTNYWYNGKF